MSAGAVRMLTTALALLAVATGCIQGEEQELKLFVQREELVDGQRCFRPCAEAPAEPIGGECPEAQPVTCELMPGFERIRVVAEYGRFALDGEDELPAPSLEFLFDGQEPRVEQGEVPRALDASARPRWVSLTELAVPLPTTPATRVRVRTKVVDGFSAELAAPLALKPVRLGLSASAPCAPSSGCVLSQSVGQVAFHLELPAGMTGEAKLESQLDDLPLGSPVPVTLEREGGRLRGTLPLSVPSGGKLWRVRTTAGGYGSEWLEFSLQKPPLALSSSSCPPESATCALELATGTVPLELWAPRGLSAAEVSFETRVDEQPSQVARVVKLTEQDGQLLARAWVDVPERGSWLRVLASAGTFTSNPLTFQLRPARVQVSLRGCESTGECVLEAGVGSVYLDVSAPEGFRPETVQLRQSVDGAPPSLADERSFEDLSTGKVAVLTARLPDSGASWALRVTAEGLVLAERSVTLRPPSVSVLVLGCVANQECQVPAGSQVTVTVDAPAASHEGSAELTYRVDAGPEAPRTPVPLDTISGSRRSGTLTLTVPADAANKRLQFFAYLGSYESRSSVLLVTPP